MSEPKKILREADSRMLVQLSVEELRGLVADVVRAELSAKVLNGAASGRLNCEQAAKFLGYSVDWLYKHWREVGGKRIGKRGIRFDAADLESWIKARG
jgi:predicted DNA-binding transcriptional regulator AlpA